MRRLNKKGQSTAEYAIVIALIIGTVIAMQTYVKRGMQGRFRDGVDSLLSATDHTVNFGVAGAGDTNYSYTSGLEGQWEHGVFTGHTTSEVFDGSYETETVAAAADGAVVRDTQTIQQRDRDETYDYEF